MSQYRYCTFGRRVRRQPTPLGCRLCSPRLESCFGFRTRGIRATSSYDRQSCSRQPWFCGRSKEGSSRTVYQSPVRDGWRTHVSKCSRAWGRVATIESITHSLTHSFRSEAESKIASTAIHFASGFWSPCSCPHSSVSMEFDSWPKPSDDHHRVTRRGRHICKDWRAGQRGRHLYAFVRHRYGGVYGLLMCSLFLVPA
ncbi:hypothetical protein FKP32DRAFT_1380218 [Trametes sanguinea]|nr:hypothetical protein FKP32DRAFT_1380218 [Trametes sanguinea]